MLFSCLALSVQPLHIDAEFAAHTAFGKPLANSLFGNGEPGRALYSGQTERQHRRAVRGPRASVATRTTAQSLALREADIPKAKCLPSTSCSTIRT
jgi:acyl dehydratase